MAADIGARIGIDGEKAFRDSLGAVNAQLKNLGSEMKAVVSSFSGMEDSEESLSAQSKVLEKSMQANVDKFNLLKNQSERAKEKLEQLGIELENATKEFGENSAEAAKAQNAYNKQVKAINNLEKQMHDTTVSINDIRRQMNALEQSADQTGNAIQSAANDIQDLGKESQSTGKQMGQLNGDMLSFGKMLGAGLIAEGISTLVSGFISAIEESQELTQSLSRLEINAQTAGNSFSNVQSNFKSFVALTNQADSSAEALANLLQTGFDDAAITQAVEALSGAVIAFPDTLSIESLADGLQETLAVGEATGQFGELLDRLGIGAESFSEQLANVSSQAEKQQLVLDTLANAGLNSLYQKYAEANSATLEFNQAQLEFDMALSNFVQATLPLFSDELSQFSSSVLSLSEAFKEGGLSALFDALKAQLDAFLSDIAENTDLYMDTGFQILEGMADGVIQGISTFAETAPQLVDRFLGYISENMPQFLEKGKELTIKIANGIIDAAPKLILAVNKIIASFIGFIAENYPQILKTGIEIVLQIIAGLIQAVPDLLNYLPQMGQAMVDTLKDLTEMFFDIGANIISGLWEGIKSMKNQLLGNLGSFSDAVNNAVREKFDINSPSKVMEYNGLMIGQGIAVGIRKATGTAVSAMSYLSNGVVNSVKSMGNAVTYAKKTARNVGDAIQSEIDKINQQIEANQKQEAEEQAAEELRQYKLSLIEKHNELLKAKKEETEDVQKIQDEIAKITEDWNKKQIEAARKAEEEASQARLEELEAFQQEYEAALEAIEDKQQSLSDSLSDYGALFEKINIEDDEGNVIGEKFQLGDIQQEIDKIHEFGNAIEELRQKGLSEGLLSEITAMGMEDALGYMDALTNLSDEQFDAYVKLFEEKQKAAQDVAAKVYQNEFEKLEQDFMGKIPESLSSLNETMFTAGQNAAKQLSSGLQSQGISMGTIVTKAISSAVTGAQEATNQDTFLSITTGMTEQEPILMNYVQELKNRIVELINSFYGEFVDMGSLMMEGLSQGVLDGKSGLINSITSVLSSAVQQAKNELQINSPSKVFENIGNLSADGYGIGWIERLQKMKKTISNGLQSVIPQTAYAGAGVGSISNARNYSYGDIVLNIARVDNGNGRNIETLARELEFFRRQQSAEKGGKA